MAYICHFFLDILLKVTYQDKCTKKETICHQFPFLDSEVSSTPSYGVCFACLYSMAVHVWPRHTMITFLSLFVFWWYWWTSTDDDRWNDDTWNFFYCFIFCRVEKTGPTGNWQLSSCIEFLLVPTVERKNHVKCSFIRFSGFQEELKVTDDRCRVMTITYLGLWSEQNTKKQSNLSYLAFQGSI